MDRAQRETSVSSSTSYTPVPEHQFTFGLWTVGHQGRDPFGEPTRPFIDPSEIVRRLADLGCYGVSMHDEDLIPFDASDADRDAIVTRFRSALDDTGMVVTMATTNLFTQPVFKEGAFTANDPDVRRFAIRKTMRSMDLGAELGAETYVLWGGREGVESMAAKDPRDALDRLREAIDFLAAYSEDRGHGYRFALEPKPNEPRGDAFLPTIGHALAFISSLDHAEMVGLNPEVAHEKMAGLNFFHGVAQAVWAGKLFHIDLNAQQIGRYDQDLRFGSEGVKDSFFLVKLLEESGYAGPKHFDARPYRTERDQGIWDFATGCMRTYLILAEKARQFAADADIAEALAYAGQPDLAQPTVGAYSSEGAAALAAAQFDPVALGERAYGNDRLDQLVMELLLGVKG